MAAPLIGSSRMFGLVLDIASRGLLIVTPAGVVVLIDGAVESRFGYQPGELVGQSIGVLLPDIGDLAAETSIAAAGGAFRQVLGRHKDGSLSPIGVTLNAVRTVDGSFVFVSFGESAENTPQLVRDQEFPEPLEFEHFVFELSNTFISAPADTLSSVFVNALGRIGERFALDACAVYTTASHERAAAHQAAAWVAEGASPAVPLGVPAGVASRVQAGETVSFGTLQELATGDNDRAAYGGAGVRSALILPLWRDGRTAGMFELVAVRSSRTWSPRVVDQLTVLGGVVAQAVERRQHEEALRLAIAETERLQEPLRLQMQRTKRTADDASPSRIVGQSPALKRVLEQVQKVATTDSTILLVGEAGTGKELFAAEIHDLSARSGRPMVRVNCAAIPGTLIESALFGREKGAFTGALARQIGRFELANQSTIFLDEIGALPPEVQVKILRVLEERRVERLGSSQSIPVDVRLIAATQRSLEQRVHDGTFRQDLYYRLNVFPIHVPPLRERQEDIPLLIWRFVEEFSRSFGKRIDTIEREDMLAWQQYPWPGNVRELRNVVERAVIAATGRRLINPVPPAAIGTSTRSSRLVEVEKDHIRGVLDGTGWRIRGVGGAADKLGMKPTTLETRMAKLGLRRPNAS